MSNLLAVPLKQTYQVEIKDPVRTYLQSHATAHPDEFKDDILEWQSLRKNILGEVIHNDRIRAALAYHAQLLSVLTKLPNDIPIDFTYAPVFDRNILPITLQSLTFERAGLLFNLAALYSQLGALEDRSAKEGIKRALSHYQLAAGTFSYLANKVLPKLVIHPSEEPSPLDLTKGFAKGLELLMLAQAQECSWQAAKIDNYKNGLIARIAARIAGFYTAALSTIREASPPIRHLFPSDWLPHIEAKEHHFEAVAQLRKSMDDIEAHRYGDEIARLTQAQVKAKRAYDVARRGKISPTVIQDIVSLLDTVEKSIKRAERDNDLIYHHVVPAFSALPAIAYAELAKPLTPPGLLDPSSYIGPRGELFGRLLSWGAEEALKIYSERRADLIDNRITAATHTLKGAEESVLQQLNLPASLEALERPIGLPPSLLDKAEEVRLEDGPAAIEASLDDVERLAQRAQTILNEAMDILDSEASEDEEARKTTQITRLPSHEANVELVEKDGRYRSILAQAAESDETVRQKWDEWEVNITELTWGKEELEAAVPSSTVSPMAKLTSQASQTQIHARSLRALLDSLKEIHRMSEDLIERATATAEFDDIRERIITVSSGFEKLAEVQPAMFEDILDEELSKYDKFLQEISDLEQRHSTTLNEVKVTNDAFLQSRKDDPAVKEREHALQSLDLAYHKYREIRRNLDEGYKFYNDLAGILLQFKEACKAWSLQRKLELHNLNRSMQSLSLQDDNEEQPKPKALSSAPLRSPAPGPGPAAVKSNKTNRKSALGLPAINSSDWGWESDELQLPPGPSR
ncbi:BRO1-domain-containing protein [Pluteus cervinus]|uniref:BRO1-domain-containing protein n=1 Tax=Pluteus cervinus TaxID=181527 RepID=A0ACD3B489_9AGAR|nr:BRO1-domain-containing protein [Pluteus cervinus]